MSARAVRARGVAKDFYLYPGLLPRLLDRLTRSRARCHRVVSALHAIDLEIAPGECLGIMGPNGAGKSTLLRLLSGGLHPTSGRVEVPGRAVMLDLGMALDPDRTGRENLVANATALGLTRRGIDSALPSMLDFSGLGEALDAPLRTYSSGMALRLSFSLYAHLEPDLLIIDEAFAVGDASFVLKCVGKLQELRKAGCAIALASHDAGVIAELCDRAIVLASGRVHFEGDPVLAGDAYHSILGLAPGRVPESDPGAPALPDTSSTEAFLSAARPRPDGEARESRAGILGVRALRNGEPTAGVLRHGDQCRIEWVVRVRETLPLLTSGIHLHAELGTYVFGTSYVHLGRPLQRLAPGDYLLAISFRVLLSPGRYLLSLGVAEPDAERHARGGRQHDRWRSAATLEVLDFDLDPAEPVPFLGAVRLPAQVEEPVRLGPPAPEAAS